MKQVPREKPQQFPGVIATLSSGFDLTTRHLWLIVLPLLLDMFYWLGPRLSVQELIQQSRAVLSGQPGSAEWIDQIVLFSSKINLFATISIPLIGVPALMGGLVPEKSPVSSPVFQVDRVGEWFLIVVGLSFLGLLLTVTYLNLIGFAIARQESEIKLGLANFVKSIGHSFINLIGLGFIFLLVLFIVWLPLLPVAFALGIIAWGLFIAVLLFGLVLVATYFFLAVPGIVFRQRPVLRAVIDSVRMVQNNILSTFNLILIVILINTGMKQLWILADDGSWLTLISISGHAFISTALIAAIFIYYRDRVPALIL